jgi:hypothetical protein
VVVVNEETLAGCTVGATVLNAQRRSVTAETGPELDAEIGVGAGDLDRGRAVVVDEGLGL